MQPTVLFENSHFQVFTSMAKLEAHLDRPYKSWMIGHWTIYLFAGGGIASMYSEEGTVPWDGEPQHVLDAMRSDRTKSLDETVFALRACPDHLPAIQILAAVFKEQTFWANAT